MKTRNATDAMKNEILARYDAAKMAHKEAAAQLLANRTDENKEIVRQARIATASIWEELKAIGIYGQ